MEQEKLNKLYKLIDTVDELKKSEILANDLDIRFEDRAKNCTFEEINERTFNINIYVLMKLYKDEIEEIKKEKGKFGLEEYYGLIESLELPDALDSLYMEMPKRFKMNKKISCATEIPSFMGLGMKRN